MYWSSHQFSGYYKEEEPNLKNGTCTSDKQNKLVAAAALLRFASVVLPPLLQTNLQKNKNFLQVRPQYYFGNLTSQILKKNHPRSNHVVVQAESTSIIADGFFSFIQVVCILQWCLFPLMVKKRRSRVLHAFLDA